MPLPFSASRAQLGKGLGFVWAKKCQRIPSPFARLRRHRAGSGQLRPARYPVSEILDPGMNCRHACRLRWLASGRRSSGTSVAGLVS